MSSISVVDKWDDGQRVHIIGTAALTGNYATGGISFNLRTLLTDPRPGFVALPGIAGDPIKVDVKGIAGYQYEYDKTNKKLIIRQNAGFTPAGTISAPTITTTTDAGTSTPVYTNGGALTQVAGATGITGVQAPTFTGTAVTAAVPSELPASALPAGVTGDTIEVYAIFKMGQ